MFDWSLIVCGRDVLRNLVRRIRGPGGQWVIPVILGHSSNDLREFLPAFASAGVVKAVIRHAAIWILEDGHFTIAVIRIKSALVQNELAVACVPTTDMTVIEKLDEVDTTMTMGAA